MKKPTIVTKNLNVYALSNTPVTPDSGFVFELGDYFSTSSEWVLIANVDITFPLSDVTEAQLNKIDEMEKDVKKLFAQKLAELENARQRFLAIEHKEPQDD